MPTSHDDLLTPTELEAAQLMVTLAWRLDGGQLVWLTWLHPHAQTAARFCRRSALLMWERLSR